MIKSIIWGIIGVGLLISLGFNYMQHQTIWNLYSALHKAGALIEDNGNYWARTSAGSLIPVPPENLVRGR